MAERIPDLDLRTQPRYEFQKYPWNDWADGSTWKLTLGEDFTVDREKFRRSVHAQAERHGMRAITRSDGPKHLLVQFVKPGDPEPGNPD